MPDYPDVKLAAVQGLVRVHMGGVPGEQSHRVGGVEVQGSGQGGVTGYSY